MDSLDSKPTHDLEALDELVRSHLDTLWRRLEGHHTVEEIRSEIIAINELLQSYQLREELLKMLADSCTTAERRKQIEGTLRRQAERMREQAAEVVSRSRQAQEKSQALRLKGRALMEKAAEDVKRAKRFV